MRAGSRSSRPSSPGRLRARRGAAATPCARGCGRHARPGSGHVRLRRPLPGGGWGRCRPTTSRHGVSSSSASMRAIQSARRARSPSRSAVASPEGPGSGASLLVCDVALRPGRGVICTAECLEGLDRHWAVGGEDRVVEVSQRGEGFVDGVHGRLLRNERRLGGRNPFVNILLSKGGRGAPRQIGSPSWRVSRSTRSCSCGICGWRTTTRSSASSASKGLRCASRIIASPEESAEVARLEGEGPARCPESTPRRSRAGSARWRACSSPPRSAARVPRRCVEGAQGGRVVALAHGPRRRARGCAEGLRARTRARRTRSGPRRPAPPADSRRRPGSGTVFPDGGRS